MIEARSKLGSSRCWKGPAVCTTSERPETAASIASSPPSRSTRQNSTPLGRMLRALSKLSLDRPPMASLSDGSSLLSHRTVEAPTRPLPPTTSTLPLLMDAAATARRATAAMSADATMRKPRGTPRARGRCRDRAGGRARAVCRRNDGHGSPRPRAPSARRMALRDVGKGDDTLACRRPREQRAQGGA